MSLLALLIVQNCKTIQAEPGISWFDNYHEIAVRDHEHVPKFWRTRRMWTNTKRHISGVIPSLPKNFPIFQSSFLFK